MSNLMTEYKDLLASSRNLSKELGLLKVNPNMTVIDALEVNVDDAKISLWSICEVVLAIHFLPESDANKYRNIARLVKGNIQNKYNSLKDILSFNSSKEILDLKDDNIFFLSFSHYLAFENFDLIFDQITKDNQFDPIWVDDIDTNKHSLNKKHINTNDISSSDLKNIARIEKDVKNKVRKLINEIKLDNSGDPKLDILLSAIKYLQPVLETKIPRYLSISMHLLKKAKPSAIISLDLADPCNRVFTLLANNLDIPVIQIQAGPINQECIEWSFCYDNLMLSHGPHIKKELTQLGFDKNKVIETGSAKLEKCIKLTQSKEKTLKNRFGIDKNSTTILFLTSYVDLFDTQKILNDQRRVYNNIYSSVISQIAEKKNISLVIKPHPLEKNHQLKEHKKISSKIENIYTSNPSDNTSEMIADADIVISYGSTATMDALVLGKLVICPKFEDFPLNEYFANSDAVMLPKNAKELNDIFTTIDLGKISMLQDKCAEGRNVFLEDFTNLNSSASKEIVSCIYNIIKAFDDRSRN